MSRHQDIFSVLRLNNSSNLRQFLAANPNVRFTDVVDKNSATVMHLACNNDNKDIVELLLNEYDRRAKLDPEHYNAEHKKYWLNLKDGQGFASLHYAVFKANFTIARLLQEHGADIYLINSLGLCVMHIAAQGDSPLLINYYMNKGFKIQVEDNKGSTPMHWACYSGRENSVNALISWGAELDCQDKIYGLTPLHLAVLSGNGKIVKKLLIRGANRNIKDFRNKLPLDIARDNEYPSISNMIEDKFGCAEFYNLKQPFRKTTKLSLPFVVFGLLYISNFGLNFARIILSDKASFTLNLVYVVLTLIPVMFVGLAGCANPGYLKNSNPNPAELFKILSKYEPSNICFDCQIVKPPRSRHCEVCRSCVMVYDHHCPWINNCVGAKNYLWFYLFILTMEVELIYTLVYEIYILSTIDWDDCQKPLCILEVISVFYSLLNCLFCIPLMILIYVQTQNCIRNETTLERYGSAAEKASSHKSSVSSSRATSMVSLINDSQPARQSMIGRAEFDEPSAGRSSQTLEQPLVTKPVKTMQNPWTNCLAMCFNNKRNLVYRIGA